MVFSKKNVLKRDNYTCQYCGATRGKDRLTIDHVVSKAKGGKTSWDNVVTACRPCNVKKGSSTLKEMNMTLIKKPHKPEYLTNLHGLYDTSPGYLKNHAKYYSMNKNSQTNRFPAFRVKAKSAFTTAIVVCSFFLMQSSPCFSQERKVGQKVNTIEHTVAAGDNLYLLAAYYFNNARLWKEIYEENKQIISNPNLLEVGMILKIPLKKKNWKPKFSLQTWRKRKK